jgi:hypothetical protein
VRVLLDQDAMNWLQRQSTDYSSTSRISVIGRVIVSDFGPKLQLLGRNTVQTFSDTKIVW